VVCLVTSDAKGAYEPLYDIDPHTGATIEIFYADPTLAASFGANAGWYWRSCQRGNRPGHPHGPYPTSYRACGEALRVASDDARQVCSVAGTDRRRMILT
jgi:hypothetical protein